MQMEWLFYGVIWFIVGVGGWAVGMVLVNWFNDTHPGGTAG